MTRKLRIKTLEKFWILDSISGARLFLILPILLCMRTVADIVRHDYYYEADFSLINNGRHFDEVIMGVDNVTLKECQLECVKHLKCKTVNYNEKKRKCELCDSDFDEWEALVKEMPDWKNYGTSQKQNGGFSDWIDGPCSVACGIGQRIRHRHCSSPHPRHGGADCVGPYFETITCKLKECPVDGGYGQWSSYGPCTKTCGAAIQLRNRSCDSPTPQYGGMDCTSLGNEKETRSCNTSLCPVNGGYGQWSSYGPCSKTCGTGFKRRTRSCDTPAPLHGGNDCTSIGPGIHHKSCNKYSCPDECPMHNIVLKGGSGISDLSSDSMKSCSYLCTDTIGCTSWIWKQDKKLCHLKESYETLEAVNGVISGTRGCYSSIFIDTFTQTTNGLNSFTIEYNSAWNTYKWTNSTSGESCTLFPRDARSLDVWYTCPYYKKGYKILEFSVAGVSGLGHEFYARGP